MKRNMLLTLLDRYTPSAEEVAFKDSIIKFVQEQENCFERTLTIGHITASCWLLNKDETHALLMHHAKLHQWFQLGGHCDGDSDVLAVAIKEAQEESGITDILPVSSDIFDIDVHMIPANSKEAEHYHYDVRFLLKVASNEQIVKNKESKELRWIGKNPAELPTASRSVARMYDKWIKYNNLSL